MAHKLFNSRDPSSPSVLPKPGRVQVSNWVLKCCESLTKASMLNAFAGIGYRIQCISEDYVVGNDSAQHDEETNESDEDDAFYQSEAEEDEQEDLNGIENEELFER